MKQYSHCSGKHFWLIHSKEEFKDELEYLEHFFKLYKNKDRDIANVTNEAVINIVTFKEEFDKFSKIVNKHSELCRYLSCIIKIVPIIKNLIASDREENWHGHLQAVQDLLPIFRETDCSNYLRYASFYLHKMRMLPTEHPDIFELFLADHFVVKANIGSFNAVAPDMKLEQTIQRSKKSSGGVIGQTSNIKFVTEWELAYHEIPSICNMFRNITNGVIDFRETDLHHEFSGNLNHEINSAVIKVVDYINSKGNPFIVSSKGNPFIVKVTHSL